MPAAAGGHRVGVADRKAGRRHRGHVVDLRSAQHPRARLVDQEADPTSLDHLIVFGGGVPRHPVREPIASAGLDEHPEAQPLILLLRQHFLELGDRAVRQADRWTTDLKHHVLHLVSSTYSAWPCNCTKRVPRCPSVGYWALAQARIPPVRFRTLS